MTNLDYALQKYREANQYFWKTHDRLVNAGFATSLDALTSHPEYIRANVLCSEAYKKLIKEQKRKRGVTDRWNKN